MGCVAAATTVAVPGVARAAAPAILKGAGDIRSLNMFSAHTNEALRTVFWIEGEYIPEACDEANWFLRDWREDKATRIDARTLDILAALQQKLDTNEPLEVLSGYRTAKTNAMLRARSRQVARHSLHIEGKACDVTLKSRSVNQIYRAAMSLHGGGVGKYTRSDFVHVDSGDVRTWGW